MNGVPCRNEENQQEKTEKTERIFLRSRLPLHCAFVPHADHLIIGSNFCQARMGGPNPRPSNFLNRATSEIREESRPYPQSRLGFAYFAYYKIVDGEAGRAGDVGESTTRKDIFLRV
jgi:hypothetical protein